MTDKNDPQRQTMALLLTMADTTWRMFVPSIVVIGVGLWADLHWGTKPWLTLVSVPLGLACSVLLVRRQIQEVK
jgi:F0F1-type ATP synthase assembly protein I